MADRLTTQNKIDILEIAKELVVFSGGISPIQGVYKELRDLVDPAQDHTDKSNS